MITTICYGTKKKWNDRKEATRYFYEGYLCSEGSEHRRYETILQQLLSGQNNCSDEEI